MDVVVPRTVPFGGLCFPEPAVTVSGTAEIVVAVLIPPDRKVPATLFGRLPRRAGASRVFSTECGGGSALAAGRYRLLLLHSPGTARVSLRLQGVRGRVALRPRPTSGARLVDLPVVPPYDATGERAASYAATRAFAGKGLVEVVGWMTSGVSAVSTLGDCEVTGSLASLPPAVAQAPGCLLGGSGQSVPGPKGSGTDFHAGGLGNIEGDTISAGFFFQSQAPATSAGGIGLWIPYSA